MSNEARDILVETRTSFQKVLIERVSKYGKCLFLDGDIQSAELDQDIYHEALVSPAFAYNPSISQALILGGGEGATAKKLLAYPKVKSVTMVDIDQQLVELCRRYLPEWNQGAFEDPRLTVYYQDAADFVITDKNKYDLVVWDLTDPFRWQDGIPTPSTGLYCSVFFLELRDRLAEGGLLSIEYAKRNKSWLSRLFQNWDKLTRKEIFLPSFEEKWVFSLLRRQ